MKQELVKAEQVTDAELTLHLENLGLVKDLTKGEMNSYLQIAKAFNLNPFKREIHVSKYNGQMSIITGYEVYIKRAERTGLLDGWSVATTGSIEGQDLKATVTIYRKDRQYPFIWEADYSEFVQKTNQGAVTRFWQKGKMMIKKVAISQGFRLCFSDELGGMPYTADEMPDKTEDVKHEVVQHEQVYSDKPDYNNDQEEAEHIASWITNVTVPENVEQLSSYWESAPENIRADKGFIKAVSNRKKQLAPVK